MSIKKKIVHLVLSLLWLIIAFFGLGATYGQDSFFVVSSIVSFVWTAIVIDSLVMELENELH